MAFSTDSQESEGVDPGSGSGGAVWRTLADGDPPSKSENSPQRSQTNADSQRWGIHFSGCPQIGHRTGSVRSWPSCDTEQPLRWHGTPSRRGLLFDIEHPSAVAC